MQMDRYFQVGTTANNLESIPYPTSVKWSYNEICTENSGRSKSAKMNKRIVAAKRKVECEWYMIDDPTASAILKKVKAHTYVYLKFMDAFEGQDIVKRFYTDDAQGEEKFRDSDGKYYWVLSFSFTEQ